MDDIELFRRLGLALSIGLMLGFERGWQQRDMAEGMRIAGIRTFALIGLLGGFWAAIGLQVGDVVMGFALLAFAALLVTARVLRMRISQDVGITSEVAGLVTFALGAVSVRGSMEIAAAGGVVTMALLALKPMLHGWVDRIKQLELIATIKLLLISVVLLPLLPNQGYGPGEALNPYKLWLIVVMIAAISYVGYFAIKLAGARIGALLTGFFGGLASSTALTVSFARLGKESPSLQPILAAGVAVACATMFARILLIVVVLQPALFTPLGLPLGIMAVAGYIGAVALWLDRRGGQTRESLALTNPFELGMAIKFALFLGAILVLSRVLQEWVGTSALYVLAGVSGLADVDAIAVSMANMTWQGTAINVAATGVVIAAVVNTLVKCLLVSVGCGGTMAWRLWAVSLVTLVAGSIGLAVV